MAKHRKDKKFEEEEQEVKEEEKKFEFKSLAEHFEEPLFVLSIGAFLLNVGYFFFRNLNQVVSMSELTFILTILILLVGLLSIYFIYLYFKAGRKNYKFLVIPLLIFLSLYFLNASNQRTGLSARDSGVFSLIFGLAVFFYAFYLHKIFQLKVAVIFTLFLAALVVHLAPAYSFPGNPWSGKFLSALDPYYYYRQANYLMENGFLMERENLNYPTYPPVKSGGSYLVSMMMGTLAILLEPLGISLYDIAMVYPGVFAALIVLVLYLLMRDLFSETVPYNYLVGILAAFMLIFSPAFAAKAIATNCEDDTLGMFLMVSGFLWAILSIRRRSFIIAVLSGFSFLMLNMTWGGYSYSMLVFGIFAFFYSITNFIHKKNCLSHLPYFVIAVLISQLEPLILHKQGAMPVFSLPGTTILLPVMAAIFASFVLEFIRRRRYGEIEIEERKIEDRVENFLERSISPLAVIIFVLGIFFLLSPYLFPTLGFGMSPERIVNYAVDKIQGAKVRDIIGKTTAEQHPFCGNLNLECLGQFYQRDKFGLGALFGFGMIPILLYFALFKKRNLGAVFVISWSLPLVWGVINKAQYQFAASVPITALGSTVGLILIMKRKDLEGLRIIPSIIFFAVILLLPWLQGSALIFGPFGDSMPMYMGASQDRIFWDGTLTWLRENAPRDSVILTWWDYGHWIAAVSGRRSILDNLKGRGLMVQDIAKFHVLVESEEEALKIARRYSADYVIIDWTMIGKSAAPHFIATSNVTAPHTDPEREGTSQSYGQCAFSPENSMLTAQLEPNAEGGFDSIQRILFVCGIGGAPEDYVGSIIFEINNGIITDIKVNPIVRRNGNLMLDAPISWSLWQQEHGGSILGVHSPRMILGNALNYGTDRYAILIHGNPDPFDTFIFVPEKFNNYMITRLYLGEYLEEYKQLGLTDLEPLEYFTLVEGFKGDRDDSSFYGYVRVWEINYPEEEGDEEIVASLEETSDFV